MSKRTHPPAYKPLLFTTTMRSLERLKGFLRVFKNYDGSVLSDELAIRIAGDVIRCGLYRPNVVSEKVKRKFRERRDLTSAEVRRIIADNPQRHKDAGFREGWPSRFDTWFKFAKELGLVFYQNESKIRFSRTGDMLLDDAHPECESAVYLNAFVKYQRQNPFRRVLNDNAPLPLLLQTIARINDDSESGRAGISKMELPLLLFWKNGDSRQLYRRIKQLRRDYGYHPSPEVIMAICRDEIMGGEDSIRNINSVVTDYPDEFIRKMRLTGLISLRGGGRFVDANQNEKQKIAYVLRHYSRYEKYATEEQYFEYMATVDENLVALRPKAVVASEHGAFLDRWLAHYRWRGIKSELLCLGRKGESKDDILKYLSRPVRLEFLTALAVKAWFPNVEVRPNFPVDDEGIPTSTAAGVGNRGDIECIEDVNGILIEVSMSEGRVQTVMEVWPIGRHLEKFGEKFADAVCYFVAPSIYADTMKQIDYLKKADGLRIYPKNIREFVNFLEKSKRLYVRGV